jgi:hypothetical protein
MADYCFAIDDGRLDDFAALFRDGTWYLSEDAPLRGTASVAKWLHENVVLYNGTPATRHMVSNIAIDFQDANNATAKSYVILFQSVPGNAPMVMFQGKYRDTFVGSDGAWRFLDRRVQADGAATDFSTHLRPAEAANSGPVEI